MTFKQFFPIPLFIAVLATVLMVLDVVKVSEFLHPWITFQAWAMYFLAGGTFKGGGKVLLGYLGGAVASAAILELAGVFAGWSFGGAAVPVAVFIIVLGVISAERVPGFDFVPAWFVGAGVFFGVMGLTQWPEGASPWSNYRTAGAYLMVSCAVGMVFGVVTVFLRTKYEAWLKAQQPAAVEDAPATEA